jgi:hypothetical protein
MERERELELVRINNPIISFENGLIDWKRKNALKYNKQNQKKAKGPTQASAMGTIGMSKQMSRTCSREKTTEKGQGKKQRRRVKGKNNGEGPREKKR